MAKYILVYEIRDYCELGGGTKYESFGMDVSKLYERVEELALEYKEIFSIIHAGFTATELEFKPISYATKFEVISK